MTLGQLLRPPILNDPNYLGFLFESLVIHNLRVYAQANDANVSYYRDSNNDEIDAIVQNRAGTWAAFEVKLGSKTFDETAGKLIRITKNISKKYSSLNIITGTGTTYTRLDGVNIISLSSIFGYIKLKSEIVRFCNQAVFPFYTVIQ